MQRNTNEYGKAVQDMVQHLPISSEALALLGDWQASTGQVEAAARSYASALTLRPDDVGLLAKLESYARARGENERAETLRAARTDLGTP
jgi:cytochrome c-type biogenesis protein CcmH/NrfG